MALDGRLGPGATVGILGGGQLGRMLAVGASRLGIKTVVMAPGSDNPAFDVAGDRIEAAWDDETALRKLVGLCDVVTYEFENVPLTTARLIEQSCPVRPSADVLAITQDRLAEKRFLAGIGVATAPFASIESEADVAAALATVGLPAIIKTRRLGYDGKGQRRIDAEDAGVQAWRELGGRPAIAEGVVAFSGEISVLCARAHGSGEIRSFDVPVNVHENHILRASSVPSGFAAGIEDKAREIAAAIAESLSYEGLLAVEMFVSEDREQPIIVNELAPRVHNSGHWTVDACMVSQFEQHIRAICGWPLGDTTRLADVQMTNLLGAESDEWVRWADETGVAVHIYGKKECRPGRKMGHLTRLRQVSTRR